MELIAAPGAARRRMVSHGGVPPRHVVQRNVFLEGVMKEEKSVIINRPFRAVSIETKLIYERLAKAAVGDVVTYEELSKLIGCDVRHHRGPVNSALNQLVRQHVVFTCVARVGFKCCSDTEKITVVSFDQLKRMRRAGKRAQRAAAAVENFEKLPRDVQTQHNVQMSIAGAVLQMTTVNGQKKIKAAVETVQHELPLAATLETFK